MADASLGRALQQIRRLFDEGTIAGLPDSQLLDRFLARGDEAAFAALVRRHGAMVLGTCRAVLRDPNDAEDAFQATFLVLICKARSIRNGDALGTWLHRVAHRIALQAGTETARRRACERYVGDFRGDDRSRHELGDAVEILHEELARLSEKLRVPLLLCDLEGKTHAQAATELNCGEATVRRRLAVARERLRSRLARRGIALSAGALATMLGRSAMAKDPADWIVATVQAAGELSSTATRIAIGEVVSTAAADLARKSLRAMLLSQLKAIAAVAVFLIGLVGLAWGIGVPGQDTAGAGQPPRMQGPQPAPSTPPAQARKHEPADPNAMITYQGRVLDPTGRPFVGAELYLVSSRLMKPDNPPVRATSGPDGRFRFLVPRTDFDFYSGHSPWRLPDTPWKSATVLARAPGFAFALADWGDATRDATLTFVRDDVPISGRIIDLEGWPVVGATVKVISVRLPAEGSLDIWLKALKVVNIGRPPKGLMDASIKDLTDKSLDAWLKDVEQQKELDTFEYPFLPNHINGQPEPSVIPDALTGPDGRFRITGVGRGRVAILEIQGPTIETKRVRVRTRPGDAIQVRKSQNKRRADSITVYGATFEHVAGPTRPIEGVVRDRETGLPLAGVIIDSRPSPGEFVTSDVETKTDAQGRYRLVGLPLGHEGNIRAIPPSYFHSLGGSRRKAQLPVTSEATLPYHIARVPVGHPPGSGPVHLDINLNRGVWVTGRVIDKATGRPVQGVVSYHVFEDNPYFKSHPVARVDWINSRLTDDEGAFRLIAFPGPGVLTVYRVPDRRYVVAAGLDTIKDQRNDWYLHTYPSMMSPLRFHVINQIDPPPGSPPITQDLLLERVYEKPS